MVVTAIFHWTERLPVPFGHWAAAGRVEEPLVGCLVGAPPVEDGLDERHRWDGSCALVLEGVDEELSAAVAAEDCACDPHPWGGLVEQVADLEPGQLAPPESLQPEHGDDVGVASPTRGGEGEQLVQVEVLTFAPRPPASWGGDDRRGLRAMRRSSTAKASSERRVARMRAMVDRASPWSASSPSQVAIWLAVIEEICRFAHFGSM